MASSNCPFMRRPTTALPTMTASACTAASTAASGEPMPKPTASGVSVKELSPSTLAARHVEGLYFAGETVDLDALTGGYNLQVAFSTGALAGQSAARYASTLR